MEGVGGEDGKEGREQDVARRSFNVLLSRYKLFWPRPSVFWWRRARRARHGHRVGTRHQRSVCARAYLCV